MKRGLFYGAVLIGLYLIVAHGTDFGRSLSAAGDVGVAGVRAFQGR